MNASLWKTSKGDWAVCSGPGPTLVEGYITGPEDGWKITGDPMATVYLDAETAMAAVLKEPLGESELDDYIVKNEQSQTRTVRTYPEVIERLEQQGWIVVSRLTTVPRAT